MEISQYWVNQIPARPLIINLKDEFGRDFDASTYDSFEVVIVGSDNEVIDTTGSTLDSAGASVGRFIFVWPTDRSLFEKTGEYVLQLVLSGTGRRDFTSVHNIIVRQIGKVVY